MRITTKAIYDIESGQLLAWEGYAYEGPVALCGGGPSSEQRDAAKSQTNLSNQEVSAMQTAQQQQQQARNLAFPYYTSRLNKGLPFFSALTDYTSGTNAKAFAPARAQILRDTSRYGSNLPSGYRDSMLANLGANQARGFDAGLTNNLMLQETAKNNAAQGIMGQQQLSNPLGWASAAGSSNNSIMNAPLAKPGWGSILGGITGSALGAIRK